MDFLRLNRQQVCSTFGARGYNARPICIFNSLLAIIKYRRLFSHHFMKQLVSSSRVTVIQNNNILLELKDLTISQINQLITNTLSVLLKRYSIEELANNNTIDLQKLILIEYVVFTKNTDAQCTAIINTFRIMQTEERKRIFDSQMPHVIMSDINLIYLFVHVYPYVIILFCF